MGGFRRIRLKLHVLELNQSERAERPGARRVVVLGVTERDEGLAVVQGVTDTGETVVFVVDVGRVAAAPDVEFEEEAIWR